MSPSVALKKRKKKGGGKGRKGEEEEQQIQGLEPVLKGDASGTSSSLTYNATTHLLTVLCSFLT